MLDCLGELNLGEFLAQIAQVPNIQDRLGSSDSDEVTVFAPSNEALVNLDDITRELLFGDATRETSVSAHIGDGSFTAKKCSHGSFIDTLAPNVTVHTGRTTNGTVKVKTKILHGNCMFAIFFTYNIAANFFSKVGLINKITIMLLATYIINFIYFSTAILREWSSNFSNKCLSSKERCGPCCE